MSCLPSAAGTAPATYFSLPDSLADENPTFGETNGRFAVGRPVLLLVEPDEATSMAATPFLPRKTRPSRSKE